jgi:hypothetical protein
VNLFEASSCAGVVAGAAGGTCLGFNLCGWAGALVGLTVGAAAGCFGMPFLVFLVFLACVFAREGVTGVRELVRVVAREKG